MSYKDLTLKADQYIRLGGIPRTREEWSNFISSWQTANSNTEEKLENFIPYLGEYIFLKEKENDKEIIKYFVGDGITPLNEGSNLRDEIEWMTFENGKTTTDQLKNKSVTANKLNENIIAEGNNALTFKEGKLFVLPAHAGIADTELSLTSSNPIANQAVTKKFNSFGIKDESGNFKISDDIKNIESKELGKILTDKYFDKIKIENILVEQDKEDNHLKDPNFQAIPLPENELYLYPNLKEIKGYVSLQCSKELKLPINLNRRWGFLNLPYGFFKCTIPMVDNKIKNGIVYGNIRTTIGSYILGTSTYAYGTILDEKDQPCGIHIAFFLYSLDPTVNEKGYYPIQIDSKNDALRLYIDIKYE